MNDDALLFNLCYHDSPPLDACPTSGTFRILGVAVSADLSQVKHVIRSHPPALFADMQDGMRANGWLGLMLELIHNPPP